MNIFSQSNQAFISSGAFLLDLDFCIISMNLYGIWNENNKK
jgi:hypothetical protein